MKYLPCGKCEIICKANCEIWCFHIKWNEINPLTPAGISHGEAIFHTRSVFHKSRKGFISLKKTYALYQSIGLFLVETEGIEPLTLRMRTVRSPSWATPPYSIKYADLSRLSTNGCEPRGWRVRYMPPWDKKYNWPRRSPSWATSPYFCALSWEPYVLYHRFSICKEKYWLSFLLAL